MILNLRIIFVTRLRLSKDCANFHCNNVTMGCRIRCGVCRRNHKPKCIGCDTDVSSERAFMCKPCKYFKDLEKVRTWYKKHGYPKKKVILKIP